MSLRRRIMDVSLGVLTLCAVVVTGLVVRRELLTSRAASTEAVRLGTVKEWRAVAEEGHRRGPRDAPVQVVVFSDYQCPYCRALDDRLSRIREDYGRQVAVVYRHFPLGGHTASRPAAVAAECAARQGRFWALHGSLFAQQDSIGRKSWTRFAEEAEIPDLDAFTACVAREAPARAVTRDSTAARELGARGTPTFLINDRLYGGAIPMDALKSEVERTLEGDRL